MKIGIIGSRGFPYVYSGYETFVSEVAPRLVNMGVEVHVYCHRQLFIEKPAEVKGVKLHYIPCIKSKALSQLSNSLLCTLHALFCGYSMILYVNSANGVFGPITKLFRKKTAINVDGLEWLRPKWKGLGAKVFYLSSKMATRWMDKIITDADAMREVYLKEFNTDSSVIAYGANTRYSKNPSLIDRWGLHKDGYYLIVGRLIPDNNALFILKEFVASTSEKKLVIVGDVPYQDEYAENIRKIKDPRVLFTGYINDQDELAELYHNCFGYFHGHEYGGTNPTLLKALAYCAPILAIDTVFSREVLSDGKYGKFFEKKDGALTSLMESTESDPVSFLQLKDISRERITASYTWDKISNQYFELVKEVAGKRK